MIRARPLALIQLLVFASVINNVLFVFFILQIIGELCFAVDINRLSGSSERLDILPAFCFSLSVVHSEEKKNIDRKIER